MVVKALRCAYTPEEFYLVAKKGRIKDLDVLIVEHAVREDREFFQSLYCEVGKGVMRPEEASLHFLYPPPLPAAKYTMDQLYDRLFLNEIFKSNMEIVLESSRFSREEKREIDSLARKAEHAFLQYKLGECAEFVKEHCIRRARINRAREEDLTELIQKVVEEKPDSEVGILVGSTHGSFVKRCQERGIRVRNCLPYRNYMFHLILEIEREFVFDKAIPEEFDSLDYLRAFVGAHISLGLIPRTLPTFENSYLEKFPLQVASRVERRVALGLSEEEIKRIARYVAREPHLRSLSIISALQQLGYNITEIAEEENEKLLLENPDLKRALEEFGYD